MMRRGIPSSRLLAGKAEREAKLAPIPQVSVIPPYVRTCELLVMVDFLLNSSSSKWIDLFGISFFVSAVALVYASAFL